MTVAVSVIVTGLGPGLLEMQPRLTVDQVALRSSVQVLILVGQEQAELVLIRFKRFESTMANNLLQH